jgi:hypothetical protein
MDACDFGNKASGSTKGRDFLTVIFTGCSLFHWVRLRDSTPVSIQYSRKKQRKRLKERKKQEVLGRMIRLLFFDTTRAAQEKTPPTILRCRRDVFTESLPSNDRGIHRQTYVSSNSSTVACIHCRAKVFTEPLPSNESWNTLYGAFA